MASTTPNKEIVRRICHLHGATKCYILVEADNEYIEVLTNISTDKMKSCKFELEQWAGMKFNVYNFFLKDSKETKILSLGEIILPINL
jgi:hypothetical protein